METVGLVLTGGGARAAYQAGVLLGLSEICGSGPSPFRVVTGVSAGAINGAAIASRADDFAAGARGLWETWSELSTDQVFRTDAPSLACIGAGWARDLALGGLFRASSSSHLLDTAPLRRLLGARIDFVRLSAHVRQGLLRGVAASATNYGSGAAVTFFDGHRSIRPWARGSRLARRTRLGVGHVMASSAIPVFFPPEALDGSFFGDGCVRLSAPLSPAIHLGADRVLAIGIRYPRPVEVSRALSERAIGELTLADIGGVLLNAVFLDSLDGDLERMERINRTLSLLPARERAAHPDGLRPIPVLAVLPSQDLGTLASEEFAHLPATLRYMLRGLGASGRKGWDLVSYLAFDAAYTGRLLALGLEDARERASELRAFLAPACAASPGEPSRAAS